RQGKSRHGETARARAQARPKRGMEKSGPGDRGRLASEQSREGTAHARERRGAPRRSRRTSPTLQARGRARGWLRGGGVSAADLRQQLFLTPNEVARLFRRGEEDLKWIWRHARPAERGRPAGFLFPAKRTFGKEVLFSIAELEKIVSGGTKREPQRW